MKAVPVRAKSALRAPRFAGERICSQGLLSAQQQGLAVPPRRQHFPYFTGQISVGLQHGARRAQQIRRHGQQQST